MQRKFQSLYNVRDTYIPRNIFIFSFWYIHSPKPVISDPWSTPYTLHLCGTWADGICTLVRTLSLRQKLAHESSDLLAQLPTTKE